VGRFRLLRSMWQEFGDASASPLAHRPAPVRQATAETLENPSYLVPPTPPLLGCDPDPVPESPTPPQHCNTQQNSLCPHSNPLPAIYHPCTAFSIRTVKVYGFFDDDVEIRKIICSTNAIESLNVHYRRAVCARGRFPTETSCAQVPPPRRPLAGPDRDAARHTASPDASMTTATMSARLSPASAARRSPHKAYVTLPAPNRLDMVTHHRKLKRPPPDGTRHIWNQTGHPRDPNRSDSAWAHAGFT
jgi:mutator family transposase